MVSEENVVGESIEEENVSKEEITINEDTTEEVLIEETPEEEVIEEETLEESVAEPEIEESIIEEPIIEEPVEEPVAEEEVINEVAIATIVEEYIDPKPRKQAINERRPAIPPTDLFAAWFEENDTIEPEEPETPAITHKPVVTELVSKPEKEQPVQTSTPIEEVIPSEEKRPDTNKETSFSPAENDEINETEPSELSKEDERFRRKLERIVNARMRNPNLNIDVIASQFGMGRTNFYRKVRELMGMSPNDYLRKCRMERAAELLQSSDQNIGEICGMVGIPDAQYFSRVFKSYFGVPPSSYREQ